MDGENSLDALRREIDSIDSAIHDLLMRRTEVVERIRGIKGDVGVPLRPGREAEILRRLAERHRGPFPKPVLVRIWREILAATVRLQGPFSMAVLAPGGDHAYRELARDQYGSHTPLTVHQSALRVIDEVTRGDATVGVLPLPRRDDAEPWWPHLMSEEGATPRIVARLPFARATAGRGDRGPEALIISRLAQEPTGRDRSLVAFEAEREFALAGLAPALADSGLPATFTAFWHDAEAPGAWLYLAEIDDFVGADDRRLALFVESEARPIKRALALGGYAIPLSARELAPVPALPAARPAKPPGKPAGKTGPKRRRPPTKAAKRVR